MTMERGGSDSSSGFKRTYTWDERGRLIATTDSNADVEYVYGEDNQRAVKSSDSGETLYFNNFWTWSNNSTVYNGERTSKHLFLGSERIVTKLNSANHPTYSEESASTYYYHSDHLGSASVISDNDGREYERIEYTPYGEVWIDKSAATYKTPYRFTGKERDEETGLYYYGARYLDPMYSRWLSTDPALGDYIPQAPINDEAKKHNQNLPGMGGVFNHINGNLYHYAGNNPVKYTDPDGREEIPYAELSQGNFKERSWFSYHIDEPLTKFCARNFFGFSPAEYVTLMDGTIVPMSESGESFSNSEKTTDCIFFCLTVFASVFKLTKACNVISKTSNVISNTSKLTAADIVFSDKFSKPAYKGQVAARGWTTEKIANTINNPLKISSSVNKATGNSATLYYIDEIHYVAQDDVTKKIIQVADLNDPNWK